MASQHSRRSRETAHPRMTIGRYTRLEEIGRGSFATVYQGMHNVSQIVFFEISVFGFGPASFR